MTTENELLPAAGSRQRSQSAFPYNLWQLPHRHPKRLLAGIVVLLVLALSLPYLYTLYLTIRWPAPTTDHRSETEFLSLTYIARDDDDEQANISAARFSGHLREMTDAGYHFIGLRDVHNLMNEGIPLPSRSVLVNVHYHGSSRGWDAWKMAVVRSRARAVMFVDPIAQRRPSWRVLRHTAATPHWDVAAAYDGFDPAIDGLHEIGSDASLKRAIQYDRLHALDQAAVQRHRMLRSTMRPPFPAPVMALSYPLSGTTASLSVKRHLLARNAAPFYNLGFIHGELAYNTILSDPYFLNGRIVPADWGERDLIRHLRAYAEMPFEATGQQQPARRSAWTTVFGSPSMQLDHLILRSNPGDITGLWLTGSDQLKTFDLEVRFSIVHGILRIPFMASADESRRWELSLDSQGNIALLKHQWLHKEEIARDRRPIASTESSVLRITQRHDQLWITLNGNAVFGGWVALHEPAFAGLMGIRLSSADEAPASAVINAYRVTPPSILVALIDGPPENDAQSVAWMLRHANRLTAVSPPLQRMQVADVDPNVPLHVHDLFNTAARIHGWDVIPHLTLRQPQALAAWTPANILDQLDRMDSNGILIRLEDGGDWSEGRLATWARKTADTLRERGYRLLIRLPKLATGPMPVTATLGRIPNVQWITSHESLPTEQDDAAAEIRVPSADPEVDLQLVYDFLDGERDRSSDDQRERIQTWRDQAEAQYAAGEYEDAIAIWFTWHEIDSHHAAPLRRIGDALHRLGYHDEAVEFYRQSLDRDPGNIQLAVLLADWIDAAGRHSEARNLLAVYNLLFPDHASILLAQALWFHRHNQPEQSLAYVERLLKQQPENLQGLLMMAQLGRDASQRRDAMRQLLTLADTPEHRRWILQGVRDADLLVLPEAGVLLTLLQMPVPEGETAMANIIEQLRPRSAMVADTAETFTTRSAWRADGGTALTELGRIHAQTDAGREEVSLRLNGTERWHDVFVEADLAEQRGDFWLVARRSRDHMIRFGFEANSDQLHLQIWRLRGQDSRLMASQNRSWTLPDGGARLRLEVRGNGVTAFIDGEPWGLHVLPLPPGVSPGWVSVSARSIDTGRAAMTLRRIAAGPVFPAFVRLDEQADSKGMDWVAERLHGLTTSINTISPSGFSINAENRWTSEIRKEDDFARLFARYHGFRLMPHVRVNPAANLHAADLLQASEVHNTDGFLLESTAALSASTIERLDRDLAGANIDVLLLIERDGVSHLRGLGRAKRLLPGDVIERRIFKASAATPEASAEFREMRHQDPVVLGL